MDKRGFAMTNYVSYEDDIMLGPSRAWLEENKDEPFMAQYLTAPAMASRPTVRICRGLETPGLPARGARGAP